MKARATFIAIALLVVGACSFGQSSSSGSGPSALTIIVDTSSSCERYCRGDFRSLALQAAGALRPADYLEIIVAGPSRPTIRLAQTIRTGSTEELKHIEAVLGAISAPWLTDASLANALEMAHARLSQLCSKQRIASVTTIVFTDGRVRGDEINHVLAMADRYRMNGWSLFLTGTRDATRELLVAANKGRLKFSLIAEANPALWLAKTESEGPRPKEEVVSPPEPKPPVQPPAPTETRTTPDRSQGRVDDLGQPQAQGQGYHLSLDSVIKVGPLPQPPDTAPAAPSPKPVLDPNRSSKPPIPPAEPELSRKKAAGPGRPWWGRLKGAFHSYWWLIFPPITALAISSIIMVKRKMAASDDALPDLDDYGPAGTSQKLMCSAGDQQHDLGEEATIDTLFVGKGPTSAVVLPDDEELEDEHVKIIRRRRGWQIENLAPQPIVVDGTTVKKGHKLDLFLPATIALTPQSRITLSRQPVLAPDQEMHTTGETYAVDDI